MSKYSEYKYKLREDKIALVRLQTAWECNNLINYIAKQQPEYKDFLFNSIDWIVYRECSVLRIKVRRQKLLDFYLADSRVHDQTSFHNIPLVSYEMGYTMLKEFYESSTTLSYTIDEEGTIERSEPEKETFKTKLNF